MTTQEFKTKYGIEKPEDKMERDMIITSNLSDIQVLINILDPEDLIKKIDFLKMFIFDTKNI